MGVIKERLLSLTEREEAFLMTISERYVNDDMDEILIDVLADLRHIAAAFDLDYDEMDHVALRHFEEERLERSGEGK